MRHQRLARWAGTSYCAPGTAQSNALNAAEDCLKLACIPDTAQSNLLVMRYLLAVLAPAAGLAATCDKSLSGKPCTS